MSLPRVLARSGRRRRVSMDQSSKGPQGARVRLLWTSQGKIDLAIGITRAEIRRSAVVRIENVR